MTHIISLAYSRSSLYGDLRALFFRGDEKITIVDEWKSIEASIRKIYGY